MVVTSRVESEMNIWYRKEKQKKENEAREEMVCEKDLITILQNNY